MDAASLSRAFLTVQALGCHNLNLVTPTHVTPQILEALVLAVQDGLTIPIVYNCGGYESPETLELLDGLVDVYMPDLKYMHAPASQRFSRAPDYPEVACKALRVMHEQVGDLEMDEQGIASRGLLVRHLVMPAGLAGTREAMLFLAREISPRTYVNVMGQYRPCHEAHGDGEIGRCVTGREVEEARQMARQAGLSRIDDPLGRLRLFLR